MSLDMETFVRETNARLSRVEAALRALCDYAVDLGGNEIGAPRVKAILRDHGFWPSPAAKAEGENCGHVAGVGCPRCDQPAPALAAAIRVVEVTSMPQQWQIYHGEQAYAVSGTWDKFRGTLFRVEADARALAADLERRGVRP